MLTNDRASPTTPAEIAADRGKAVDATAWESAVRCSHYAGAPWPRTRAVAGPRKRTRKSVRESAARYVKDTNHQG